MKAVICYFSGTGNTKRIVDEYVRVFSERGVEVEVCNIEKSAGGIDFGDCDLAGFAYPIWAFNAPKIVLDFAKALEKSERTVRSFIVKTSGEPVRLNDASSNKLVKLLKKKNFAVLNEYHYCMPYNIIFRHSRKMAHRMWQAAQEIIPLDCDELLSGEERKIKKVAFGNLLTGALRIQQWGGRFNGRYYKVYDDMCVHCNKCVNNCPVGNITVTDGKFGFGKKCLMCMRCAFECPKNAIKIGLFEKWKVNGAYSFAPPAEPEPPTKHDGYCKKAYDRYFANIEERLKKAAEKERSGADEPNCG